MRGRSPRIQAAWARAALVVLASSLAIAGCSSVPGEPTNQDRIGVAVDAGQGSEYGGWRAWAYLTRAGELCVEVAGTAGGGYHCGRGASTLRGPGVIRTEKGTFITGGSSAESAATAELADTDGSGTTVPLVSAGAIAPGWRVYLFAADTSAHPRSVQVIDNAGVVIESAVVGY